MFLYSYKPLIELDRGLINNSLSQRRVVAYGAFHPVNNTPPLHCHLKLNAILEPNLDKAISPRKTIILASDFKSRDNNIVN